MIAAGIINYYMETCKFNGTPALKVIEARAEKQW
jgi:hypothetical protein